MKKIYKSNGSFSSKSGLTYKNAEGWGNVVPVLIFSAILLAMAVPLIKLFKRGSNGILNMLTNADEEKDSLTISNTIIAPVAASIVKSKLSYTPDWYKQAALKLMLAMQDKGTDTVPINLILEKLKTPDDAKQLYADFGSPVNEYLFFSDAGDLLMWFKWELVDIPTWVTYVTSWAGNVSNADTVSLIVEKFKNTGIDIPWTR